MQIDLSDHRKALIQEYQLQKTEFEKVLYSPAHKLREHGKLYFAKYSGFDNVRGNIVLILSTLHPFPRRNEHLTAFIPHTDFLSPKSWGHASYQTIRSNPQRFCELVPIWFKFEPDDKVAIGFRGADTAFIENLPKNIPILLGPQEPPTEYLGNLIFLLGNSTLYPRFSETVLLQLESSRWEPELLENDTGTSLRLSAELSIHRDVIIQGPPGTGKSHLAANLCAEFLGQGKTVLVASLTNTALMELAHKSGLEASLQQGRVYKTSLTVDENRQLPQLKNGADYAYPPGSLLLSTYYRASAMAKAATGPQFDLVIVEEASQAFLSTIGALRYLGQHCVIIGDQMQLQPIRMIKDVDLDSPELVHAFNGLNAVANSGLTTSGHILNKTFRLNPTTTSLTNTFYDDRLVSVQPPLEPMNVAGIGFILSVESPVRCVTLPMSAGVKCPAHVIESVRELVEKLRRANPKAEIAVLSTFVATVKALQQVIYPDTRYSDRVTVETIDRIQGLTVDICIVLIPNASLAFSLNVHRFNVATSRARHHTILFVPNDLSLANCDERVTTYFERLAAF